MRPGKRPSTTVIVLAAACAALVAAIIALDSTAARQGKPVTAPPAPAFTLPSLRDPAQLVSLSAYRGRPVIVNFFASWCGPCRQETPLLARFYRGSRGKIMIIGVGADHSAPAAPPFPPAYGVSYPVAFESSPLLSDAYGVNAIVIPETFFLDSKHRLLKALPGCGSYPAPP